MNTINLLEKLKTKTIFRIQDIERVTNCNQNYAKQIINRLHKKKLIKKIMKNTYTTKDNIFVIASNITSPAYISFWSASSFLGYTEQTPKKIQIAATRKISPILFEKYEITFHSIKKNFFGYRKIKTEEGDIFIAENEKLVIDALLKPNECGNFEEIEFIFRNAEISKEKLITYLKKINKQTITKRAGYLIEKTKKWDLSKDFKLDNNYALLNPFSKKWEKINSKWRIKE